MERLSDPVASWILSFVRGRELLTTMERVSARFRRLSLSGGVWTAMMLEQFSHPLIFDDEVKSPGFSALLGSSRLSRLTRLSANLWHGVSIHGLAQQTRLTSLRLRSEALNDAQRLSVAPAQTSLCPTRLPLDLLAERLTQLTALDLSGCLGLKQEAAYPEQRIGIVAVVHLRTFTQLRRLALPAATLPAQVTPPSF
jgi:hypothetical protein